MVLADSSVWIDHFRGTLDGLDEMLDARSIVMHDHVLGELALGSLRDRTETLWNLGNLPRAPLATDAEVMVFIESRRIFSRGIGYSDAHLLASAMLGKPVTIWTKDTKLAAVAAALGVCFAGP
jgi:predicted nucleic acid-binding protein